MPRRSHWQFKQTSISHQTFIRYLIKRSSLRHQFIEVATNAKSTVKQKIFCSMIEFIFLVRNSSPHKACVVNGTH